MVKIVSTPNKNTIELLENGLYIIKSNIENKALTNKVVLKQRNFSIT